MLAGPDVTLATMLHAVNDTVHALEAAAELDTDRSKEDRKFFADRRKKLLPLRDALAGARRAVEDFDLEDGSRLQARVEMGDAVLDRGVAEGNARTKLGLRSQAGLDATHVFGRNVATLTKEKIALEPAKVLEAVERLGDVADFADKKGLAKDLTARAKQQQGCLDEREAAQGKRAKLVTAGIKAVLEGAHGLASLKGALDERFPRQRDYVAAFFRDVGARKKASDATEPEAPDAGPPPPPAG